MKKQLLTISTIFITYLASAQVGVGTNSPSEALDVETSDGTKTAIDINNTSTGDPKINFQLNGTSTFSIGIDNSDAGKLKIGTTALENNTRLTIDASGNCGIGTTTPSAKLDVDGSAIFNESGAATNFRVESDANANMIFVDGTNDRVGIGTSSPSQIFQVGNAGRLRISNGIDDYTLIGTIDNNGSTNTRIVISGQSRVSNEGLIEYVSTGTGYHKWFTNGSDERMRLSNSGNLGVGTDSPGYLLTVNGQPAANGFTAFTNYSDRRLKTNIATLDTGALSKIMQLRPVSFQYNQKYLKLYPNSNLKKVNKGFIAQEIRKVFPEMVSEIKENSDSVQYLDLDVTHLQVYLVKALQEQQEIIKAQNEEINLQKAEAELQKAEIDAQKSEIDVLKENTLRVAELEGKLNALLLLMNKNPHITSKK